MLNTLKYEKANEMIKNNKLINKIIFKFVLGVAYLYFEIDESKEKQFLLYRISIIHSYADERHYSMVIDNSELIKHFNIKTDAEFIEFFSNEQRAIAVASFSRLLTTLIFGSMESERLSSFEISLSISRAVSAFTGGISPERPIIYK